MTSNSFDTLNSKNVDNNSNDSGYSSNDSAREKQGQGQLGLYGRQCLQGGDLQGLPHTRGTREADGTKFIGIPTNIAYQKPKNIHSETAKASKYFLQSPFRPSEI